MRNLKTCLMASVALVTFGVAEQANAQTIIYGGGATLPSKAYRQLMDCLYFPVDGNTNPAATDINGNPIANAGNGVVDLGLVSPPVTATDNGRKVNPLAINSACPSPTGWISASPTQMLYAPVGSGGGKRAFRNFNASIDPAAGLGTPSSSNSIPYVSAFSQSYGYPRLHFIGSDDIVLPSDVKTYSSASSATSPINTVRGYWLQIPALAAGVTVAYNQKDGSGNALTVGANGLQLSRKTLCGIVSGHITQWNNSNITADNGAQVGTGPITFVHRSDGSGTNFLFTNAMVAQCAGLFGPTSETNSAMTLWSFPWTDFSFGTSACPAAPIEGSNQTNWPDNLTTGKDQCGNTITNSGGILFANGNGNGGVVSKIHSINGAIGYATPDFVDPVVAIGTNPADGLPTAAIQNQYDIDNGTTPFQKPTFAKVAIAMSAQSPVFDDTSRANPLNWSRQMVNPNPILADAYPIAGFTQLNLYQCYANNDVYSGLLNYLVFHYTNANSNAILHTQQFSEIPDVWLQEVIKLVNPANPTTGFNLGNNGACAGHSGQPG